MKTNLKERARKLKSDIPAVFIALKDKRTPIIAKILAGITIGYALSPIDLVPDFIPVLGYLDDVLILPALVALTIKCIPNDVWQSSKEKSADMWSNGRPKHWYYAVPVIIIWLLIIWMVVKCTCFYLYMQRVDRLS